MDDSEKLKAIAAITQKWLDKQGHERCWYYPDYFQQIVEILGLQLSVAPQLPPEDEFQEFCNKYRKEQYATFQDAEERGT